MIVGLCVMGQIKDKDAERVNLRDARLRRDAQHEAAKARKLAVQLRRELEMQRLLHGADTTR